MTRATQWIVITLALCASTQALLAQDITASLHVDSTRYLIGEWIVVDLHVTAPKDARIQLPASSADFEKADFISMKEQSVEEKNGRKVYARRYTLASFDTGKVEVQALVKSFVGDDTSVVRSEPLVLEIRTVELDTSITFKEIKDVLDVPLTVWDYLLYAGIILAIVALLYFGWRWYKRRPEPETAVEIPPDVPAHEIALQRLHELEAKNMWQNGNAKEYQSELTEILRWYIEHGHGVPALEQVTSEIIAGIALHGFEPHLITRLEQVLRVADMTKFAKYLPMPSEHHEALKFAYEFIEKTKPVKMTEVAENV